MEIMNRYEAYEKAMFIIAKGYPNNSDELEYLVLFLANTNGLAYDEIIDHIKSIGEPVIPHIKKNLLLSDEGEFHSSLLHAIVRDWPKEWIEKIGSELEDLAWYGNSDWGVDTEAIEILIKNGMVEKVRMKSLIDGKIQGCNRYLKNLEDLKRLVDETE